MANVKVVVSEGLKDRYGYLEGESAISDLQVRPEDKGKVFIELSSIDGVAYVKEVLHD